MVHFMTPNSQRFPCYDCRKLAGLLKLKNSGQTWPFSTSQVFGEISPWPLQKLCMRKMPLTNTAFCWLLIQPDSTYGLVATEFWSQASVLCRFWTDLVYRWLVRFLGHKMVETCWGLNTCSEGNKLIFPTPTQTHIFDNRSNGYDHLGTAHVRSLAGR
jgi:hypothetical protein